MEGSGFGLPSHGREIPMIKCANPKVAVSTFVSGLQKFATTALWHLPFKGVAGFLIFFSSLRARGLGSATGLRASHCLQQPRSRA